MRARILTAVVLAVAAAGCGASAQRDASASRLQERARLDRLLMLIEIQQNGQADQTAYAPIIRDWLLAHGGRPQTRRRELADPIGRPSLRAPRGAQKTTPRRPKTTAPAEPGTRTGDPQIDAVLDDPPF
jgi:hypothetical protein